MRRGWGWDSKIKVYLDSVPPTTIGGALESIANRYMGPRGGGGRCN